MKIMKNTKSIMKIAKPKKVIFYDLHTQKHCPSLKNHYTCKHIITTLVEKSPHLPTRKSYQRTLLTQPTQEAQTPRPQTLDALQFHRQREV